MRVSCIVVALLFCWLSVASAANKDQPESAIVPGNPDLLMRWDNGQLRLLTSHELESLVQYLCRIKLYADEELISESEVLVIQGLPAVITANMTNEMATGDQPMGDNSYLIVIKTPEVPNPPESNAKDLDWVKDWEGTTQLRLRDLEFYIRCPGADRVVISAEKLVRPAAVIDDQEGNIVFEMHYPEDLPPESYGEISSMLRPTEPAQLTRRPFNP